MSTIEQETVLEICGRLVAASPARKVFGCPRMRNSRASAPLLAAHVER